MDSGRLPHAILLTGPSGTGKTTIARILRDFLDCSENDYQEIDCAAVEHPLETVRSIHRAMRMSPLAGSCRVFFLEEAQSLSRAGFSQQAMLKMLEDVPSYVYFILASTDSQKLISTIHTRCTELRLNLLAPEDLRGLLLRVIGKEGFSVSQSVVEEIIEAAEGSARKALVILEQVGSLESQAAQMDGIKSATVNKVLAIDLARALIKPGVKWLEVAMVLKAIKDKDEPEAVRYLILGYARTVLLGGGPLAARAFKIIDIFSKNFYDSKQAGLAAACWEVVML